MKINLRTILALGQLTLFVSMACADVVYDNTTTRSNPARFAHSGFEFGEEIILAGQGTWSVNNFQYEFFGFGPDFDTGKVSVRLRFYRNDGDNGTPGSVLFDSGSSPIPPTGEEGRVLEYPDLNVVVPKNFTWTVDFAGLSGDSKAGLQSAGLDLYQFPSVGQTFDDYWERSPSGKWELRAPLPGQPPINFGCRVTASYAGTPAITGQPGDVVTCEGETVVLAVTAIGTPTLKYQWFKDKEAIAKATSSSLVLNTTSAGDVGEYFVKVSNGAGTASSSVAHLSFKTAILTITEQPKHVVVCRGDSAELTVIATAETPLAYQWFFGEKEVEGATGSALLIPVVDIEKLGTYTVVVKSCSVSVESEPVELGVFDLNQKSPCLKITRGGAAESTVVSWTSFYGPQWILQQAETVDTPDPWLATPFPPTLSDGRFTVVVPAKAALALECFKLIEP